MQDAYWTAKDGTGVVYTPEEMARIMLTREILNYRTSAFDSEIFILGIIIPSLIQNRGIIEKYAPLRCKIHLWCVWERLRKSHLFLYSLLTWRKVSLRQSFQKVLTGILYAVTIKSTSPAGLCWHLQGATCTLADGLLAGAVFLPRLFIFRPKKLKTKGHGQPHSRTP